MRFRKPPSEQWSNGRVVWCAHPRKPTNEDGEAGNGSIQKPNCNAMENSPKFHNAAGATIVRIGCREFKCIGDRPPQDHPHVYLNMGTADEIICPYCATVFRFDASLGPGDAEPADCAYSDVGYEAEVKQLETGA